MSRFRNIFYTVQRPEKLGYFIKTKNNNLNQYREELSTTLRAIKIKQQIYKNLGKVYYTSPGETYVKGSTLIYKDISTSQDNYEKSLWKYQKKSRDGDEYSKMRRRRREEEDEDAENEDDNEEEEEISELEFKPRSADRILNSFQQKRRFSTCNLNSSTRLNDSMDALFISKREFSNSLVSMEEKKGFFSKVKDIIKGPSKEQQQQNVEPKITNDNTVNTKTTSEQPTTSATDKPVGGFFSSLGQAALEKMAGEEAAFLKESLEAGKFDLEAFRIQIKYSEEKSNSPLMKMMGASQMIESMKKNSNNPETKLELKILDAMSEQERKNPNALIEGEYKVKVKNAIAQRAGTDITAVNRLINKYQGVKVTMERMFQYQKQGKPLPNSFEELVAAVKKTGGFTKKELDILKKMPR